MKIFVEGGGDNDRLRTECRKAFSHLISKIITQKKPRFIACGTRNDAFKQFNIAINETKEAVLLVDSEAPIKLSKWQHVKTRDNWDKPLKASETHLFFMIEVMESWIICDKNSLLSFYGQGFNDKKLPKKPNTTSKSDIYKALKQATKNTKTKGEYGKGAHSFKLLSLIDPSLIQCAEAQAFFSLLNGGNHA